MVYLVSVIWYLVYLVAMVASSKEERYLVYLVAMVASNKEEWYLVYVVAIVASSKEEQTKRNGSKFVREGEGEGEKE